MRIGLFSDVHGNLAGLQAVANELDREGPIDHVVVAGDHLWGGPRSREAWRLLSERGWTLVLGNADQNLLGPSVDQDFPRGNRYRSAAIRQREWLREQLDSGTGASAIAFGHWHAAFVRQTSFAILINVASVGLPLDGRPLAAYTILTATPGGYQQWPWCATEMVHDCVEGSAIRA